MKKYKLEVTILCSVVSPYHGERNPSCGISASKEVGGCFACGQHFNLVQLVSFCKQVSISSAQELLSSYTNSNFKSVGNITFKLYGENTENDNTLPITALAPFSSGEITHNYLTARGFSNEDLVKFKIGWDKVKKRLTIPFFNESNELLGFSGRAILNEKDFNYTSVYGNEAKYYIYNHFKAKDYFFPMNFFKPKDSSVIIVEGLLDAMWLHKFGYTNALSIVSADVSKVQLNKLKNLDVNTVILCLDNDVAGKKGCERLYKKLKSHFLFKKAVLPDGKKDVQDCSKEELDKVFKNLEDYPIIKFKRYE